MTLARDEQQALHRLERSLLRDPALRAAADKFSRGCPHGRDPAHECLSPWHPVLWRVVFIALLLLSVAFVALVATLAVRAL
jgi:hypothetical protein